jgi:putative spermidine/putrescine transport system permease protein
MHRDGRRGETTVSSASPALPASRPVRAHRRWLTDRTVFHLFIAPAFVLLVVCYLYPLGRVLWISVTEPTFGLDNYKELASASVIRVAWNTARICTTATLITLLLSYVVAYALTHARPRVQQIMMIGILLPLWVSVLVRSFAWIVLLRREGVINTILMNSGITQQPLAMIWNEFGVMVGMVHYMLPYGILPLVANMRQINPALTAAARGLGASRTEAFWRVFLPLSRPGIIAAGVLVFIFSLGFYVTPTLLGGGRLVLITEYISAQILDVLRWGMGTMLATSLIIVIGSLLALLSGVVDLRKTFGTR